MKKVELLAPAGTKESLVAAISGGASAVYLAGKSFGARASATNFSNDELVEAIKYAHVRNVKVYVTVNTLLFTSEINDVLEFVKFIYLSGVDGIIVQDLGLLVLARNLFPSLKIIASTQMSVHSVEHAKLLQELGVKRIVVAREITYEQIKNIKEQIDIEIEAFAHGAICVCFSGNCLMSSMIGKRSGNRGRCAQPCRLPYTLTSDGGEKSDTRYWLSPKELMTLSLMDRIHDSHIDSLKIEGRMKNSEYVFKTVESYRKLIDQYYETKNTNVSEDDVIELKKLFNRDFTSGYIGGTNPYDLVNPLRPNHLGIKIGKTGRYNNGQLSIRLTYNLNQGDGIRILTDKEDIGFMVNRLYLNGLLVNKASKGDVVQIDLKSYVKEGLDVLKTSDVKQLETINKEIVESKTERLIDMEFKALLDEKIELSLIDTITNKTVTIISEDMPSIAKNNPTNGERITQQLSKLGDTPFKLNTIKFKIDNNIYLPVSILNQIRRDAVDRLIIKLGETDSNLPLGNMVTFKHKISVDEPLIAVKVHTLDQLEVVTRLGMKTIYYDDELTLNQALLVNENIIPMLSRVNYEVPSNLPLERYLVNELGSVYKYRNDKELIGDAYLNVTNQFTLAKLYELGLKRVTLSPELSFSRIKDLINGYKELTSQEPNLEMIVYGRYDLMFTKYCPITTATKTNALHCAKCKEHQYNLIDRLGYSFPILGNPKTCHVRILNSKRVHLVDYIQDLKKLPIQTLRLEFTIESKEEVEHITNLYLKAFNGEKYYYHVDNVTFGHFNEDIE
jgi:putative protease